MVGRWRWQKELNCQLSESTNMEHYMCSSMCVEQHPLLSLFSSCSLIPLFASNYAPNVNVLNLSLHSSWPSVIQTGSNRQRSHQLPCESNWPCVSSSLLDMPRIARSLQLSLEVNQGVCNLFWKSALKNDSPRRGRGWWWRLWIQWSEPRLLSEYWQL